MCQERRAPETGQIAWVAPLRFASWHVDVLHPGEDRVSSELRAIAKKVAMTVPAISRLIHQRNALLGEAECFTTC